MIAKLKRHCGGSLLLTWLILVITSVWSITAIIWITGKSIQADEAVTEWLTLPAHILIFLNRPWTIFTYMMIHFDILHMLFNVLWLYWFGKILLISQKDRNLGIYFFGGGIVGGFFFMAGAAMGLSSGWLCGCSAAVIAVMSGAAIRHPNLELRFFLIGHVRLKWVAIVCCLLTFIGGGGNQAAHIGGLAWGLVLGSSEAEIKFLTGRRIRKADKMIKALNQHRANEEKLNELLDKIRISGYESLSRKERRDLNELSQTLRK